MKAKSSLTSIRIELAKKVNQDQLYVFFCSDQNSETEAKMPAKFSDVIENIISTIIKKSVS